MQMSTGLFNEPALHVDTYNGTIYSAWTTIKFSHRICPTKWEKKVLIVYNFTPVPLQDSTIVPTPGR